MDVLQISSQFYVVRYEDDAKSAFAVLDGPYPEWHQAVSMGRVRDI